MSDRAKCTGKSKRTGGPCTQWPIKGGVVCWHHGGAAPQVQRAAAARVATEQATQYARKMGWTAVTDPLTALGEVAGEMLAMKERLGAIVDELADTDLTGLDYKGQEYQRANVAAYSNLLNNLVTALSAMGKLNIDERLAKINEQQATGLIAALRIGLAAIGINGEAARTAELAAGRHLAKLGAGS